MLGCCLFLVAYGAVTLQSSLVRRSEREVEETAADIAYESKLVLDWTGFFGQPIHASFQSLIDVCPEMPACVYSSNKSLFESADAILFHLADMPLEEDNDSDNDNASPAYSYWPPSTSRRREQRFVLFSFESPSRTEDVDLRPFKRYFNLTMSYRSDSDIWFPYGYFGKSMSEDGDNDQLTAGANKSRLLLWFSSNCKTHGHRELVVNKLRNLIPVDVFGRCSKDVTKRFACPKHASSECETLLAEQYFFYLAFENSVCDEYVTEKFFRSLRLYRTVPVVLRRRDYGN